MKRRSRNSKRSAVVVMMVVAGVCLMFVARIVVHWDVSAEGDARPDMIERAVLAMERIADAEDKSRR